MSSNYGITVGGDNCVVADPFCLDFDPCQACKDETRHQIQLRRTRENNIARQESYDALGRVVAENPGATLVGLGILGAIAGGIKLHQHIKEKKAQKSSGRSRR